jgi:hypothetical protein
VSVLSVPRSHTATTTVAMRKAIIPTTTTGSGAINARGSVGIGFDIGKRLVRTLDESE